MTAEAWLMRSSAGGIPVVRPRSQPRTSPRVVPVVEHIDFAIEVTGGHTSRIAVCGELDLCSCPELRAALARERAMDRPTVVDLSGVTFIDPTGIVTLLRAVGEAQEDRWQLGIAAPLGEVVTETARICGVLARLPLVEQ